MAATDKVLVVGAGPAGLEAARGAAGLGRRVVLVERGQAIGGTPYAQYATLTPDLRPATEAMRSLVEQVQSDSLVEIRLGTEVVASSGAAPNFQVALRAPDGTVATETVGAIVLATGFEHFDPGRATQIYGYYEYQDVITLVDAERMFKEGRVVRPSTGTAPERVCFIQCVGSRDRQVGNSYCSKVCCAIASKQAIEIKEMLPAAKVFIFYIDMRTYGFFEDQLYWRAQEEHRVNYIRGVVTEVIRRGERLLVKGEDTTFGRPLELEMDLVILSVGMEPSRGTREAARIFGLPLEPHGFIATAAPPLDAVSTPVPGIFVAGAAAGPRDLEESVAMGGAAALKAVTLLGRLQPALP